MFSELEQHERVFLAPSRKLRLGCFCQDSLEFSLLLATGGPSLSTCPGRHQGTDAGLGDSFSHAARAAGVAIMVSNSIGVKRPSAA